MVLNAINNFIVFSYNTTIDKKYYMIMLSKGKIGIKRILLDKTKKKCHLVSRVIPIK